ncbi:MAG: transcription-repair coupling factor [Deltaproteobacteria bacterium]|nr:transcription-repair coupling factor [Deltaproteobacteria bacterium]
MFVDKTLGPLLLTPPFPKGVKGLDCASEAYLLSELIRTRPKQSFLRVTPDLKSGLTLKQNLEFFLGPESAHKIIWFPPHDVLPYTGIVTGSDIAAERIATLSRLLEEEPSVLIAPWPAFFRKVIPPQVLKKQRWTLCLYEEIRRETLLSWLIDNGYHREVVVESPGEFAVRGGLVDIFSPQMENPCRLEFEGDCLAEIRWFDAATQTTVRSADIGHRTSKEQVILIPASEILFAEEFSSQAARRLKKFADDLELPATLRKEAVDKIEAKESFTGIDTFLPAFYETPATLFDYLQKETIVFLPDPEELKEIFFKTKKEILDLYQSTGSLERLIHPDMLLHSYAKLEEEGMKRSSIFINPLLTEGMELKIDSSVALKAKWNRENLKEGYADNVRIRCVCHTPIQAERLKDLLKSKSLPPFPIELGFLSQGFGWPAENLIVLTEEENFGHKMMRRTRQAKAGLPIPSFAELKTGDYLVHEEHGICRYAGLTHMKTHGIDGDYLKLEFLSDDKLYLPVYRMTAIQRYIGAEFKPPMLDQLGGVRWQKIKKRAGEYVYKIAQELLKIHAQRELNAGVAFPAPDSSDEEFASHFPYDETPDQAQAIDDVLRDMQESKPMDRLICGDVGYGKTEVALRAAFKAVSAGKQVGVLVPTTVLALQHFETFQERFSKLGVSVDMLSRFRSRSEQKEILEKLETGKLDIVIATHRILAKDCKFKQLGLLIIDEEHRFGVKHKEKIKKIRPTVDVLTLSATPIPRTLHMSLIGLRDLSLIHTPPVDRLSIRTFIAKWDDAVVRHAVEQELARGGQIFFVHNRVATIESMRKRLADLFPGVSIAVGHGQMDEEKLEQVMIDFLHQKTQILLCTTIIESGIDVPTANTMIINRADMFGLAQLYQLRGRVGRSDRQAFCYLLVPDEEVLAGEARQRLHVLTRYTELGAGFKIASHDLEIRGAGNLLGTSQAGFIEEVGYELYTKLLSQTIRRLRGEKLEEDLDPEMHLKVPAFIPEDYVADPALRMELYKRMSHISKPEEKEAFVLELTDRFGPVPEPTLQLLEIIEIKQMAVNLRIKSLQFDGERFVFSFDASTPVSPEILFRLAQKHPKIYQIKPSGAFFIKVTGLKTPMQILEGVKKELSELSKKTMDVKS